MKKIEYIYSYKKYSSNKTLLKIALSSLKYCDKVEIVLIYMVDGWISFILGYKVYGWVFNLNLDQQLCKDVVNNYRLELCVHCLERMDTYLYNIVIYQ